MILRRLLHLALVFASVIPAAAGEILPPAASAEEISQARVLAEEAMVTAGIPLAGQVYFVAADRIRDKADESANKILITHFRYEGSTAILSLVDLDLGAVEVQHQRTDVETDISVDEVALAEQMARSLPEVAARQAASEEPLVAEGFQFSGWVYNEDERSNRVVGFQFYQAEASGGGYIEELGTVVVDLEKEMAWIDPAAPGASGPDPLELLVTSHPGGGESATLLQPKNPAAMVKEPTAAATVSNAEAAKEATLSVAKGEER